MDAGVAFMLAHLARGVPQPSASRSLEEMRGIVRYMDRVDAALDGSRRPARRLEPDGSAPRASLRLRGPCRGIHRGHEGWIRTVADQLVGSRGGIESSYRP